MPRKGVPTNWKAAEHSTALSGVIKTMQSNLLNGANVGQFKEEFLSQVVELAIALQWERDLQSDLNHALGVVGDAQTIKATIVEQPKPASSFFGRK